MTQDEVSLLSDQELQSLSQRVAEFWSFRPDDKERLRHAAGLCWNPLIDISQAMLLAALMDMNICFGDKVVLVSEPNSAQSRSIDYTNTGRISAMQRAITLLAADCAEYI
ncbi:hypothetical protein GCM10027361_00410 [Erwinia aphidicola]|uniref:hypothetical protein n=1 Tax=Erwinia aphidicola TaxID=68334 RepID=UPI001745C5C6|nr:hypothetical protein [Erwinia aphidicola]MBD1377240.1 hypothetical protein [Erwinia aphidicola]